MVALPVAAGAGLLAWKLSAADPVVIAGQPVTPEARRVCAALVASLPDSLGGLSRRAVSGDVASVAAWGDPPVGLRCGGPAPASPLGQIITIDGLDWAPLVDSRGVAWTTTGRQVTVVVRFPKSYDSQGTRVAVLSKAILRTVPR